MKSKTEPERIWVQHDTKNHRTELNEMAVEPVAEVAGSFSEYVRSDHANALVAAALRENCVNCCGTGKDARGYDCDCSIPPDAQAALEAVEARAREEGLREAAFKAKRFDDLDMSERSVTARAINKDILAPIEGSNPMTDQYTAGRAAGIREAAELADALAVEMEAYMTIPTTTTKSKALCIRNRILALLDKDPKPGGVKVKPLEWKKEHFGWSAGPYKVCGDDEEASVRKNDRLYLVRGGRPAAQADYERRILSALEPDPSSAQSVAEAAKVLAEDDNAINALAAAFGVTLLDAANALHIRAALRAIAETETETETEEGEG